ncbi:hypothetical protein [Pararhodobacter zhoushanensis]|uniref:hypothetical protein n=1 Tax=Pararhodobacter zhoushanensis TaxID=2479545 RepID=UPI000F8F46FB|nr:hypothetical protein [Pararhodobacter zhoushanensis]
MKKIDLHMHTKSSSQDKDFIFSLDNLKRYVADAELDCISITNHNLFDVSQFELIRSSIDALCLPGIEVDVENCHILVISSGQDLNEFSERCQKVSDSWADTENPLNAARFEEIFGNLSQYILIPHYLKNPRIGVDLLGRLSRYITCGEVSSPKKFLSCVKDAEMLIPVFFSDCRISECLSDLPTKQTYIDCDDISFGSLRQALKDKSKVKLSKGEGNKFFQIGSDGQLLSTGLNVVLGDRSSGKSHTLQRVFDWFGEENSYYIRQFDLVSRDEAEDAKKFKDFLSESTSLFARDYLSDLQSAVADVLEIDLESDNASVEKYISSLLSYARETSRQDAFSKAKFFSEDAFRKKDLAGLIDLVSSTKKLVSNVEYREAIDKHLNHDSLKALYVELMRTYEGHEEVNLKKEWVNSVLFDIKGKLQRKSSATGVTEVDLFRVASNKNAVKKFEELVEVARMPKTPLRKRKGSFEVVAQVGRFSGAGELKAVSRSPRSFSAAFSAYSQPYKFIQELRKIGDPVVASEFSRYLVKVDYKILNRDGLQASGGERSEFFLLDRIEGASSAEVLLIDEPESSFDNHFLKAEVNEMIKEMSAQMPVVVVTHNNTVGVSIRPDFLLYTRKDVEMGELKWRIYSGRPSSKTLVSTDGLSLNTRDVLLGNLEAGVATYEERSATYEDLKN